MKKVKTIQINGQVKEGRFVPYDTNLFKAAFKGFEGKNVSVLVKEFKHSRTTPQNAYYWGVVIPLVCEGINNLGNQFEHEEIHEFLKNRFLSYTKEFVNENTGELATLQATKSTTKLNTIEFGKYLDDIALFAAEYLQVEIPFPEKIN